MQNKSYEPSAIEQKHYQEWEQKNYFTPSGSGDPYCITIPPPNVTGTLHMGHGFQQSIMDVLIRYHRMRGDNTLWQLGTDHAGIATQMVVENLLRAEGTTRHELGRDKFVERIWDWKKYSGDTISKQERRLGISGDWSREKFTLDPDLAFAVQEVFIKLYEEGLIYRGKRLVNWDPVLNTAISDLEVISQDTEGSLWYIRYSVVDSDESITIATTRPETMLGDAAVAVNPKDERYQHLIGKQVKLPLTGRLIPIIADDYVEQEFGTGCLKITPAHDFNDYAIGQRHNLPLINIFTKDALINENAPEIYQGLDRFIAREKILADLAANNLLIKTEKHQLKIPKGDRSGAIVEPYLTDQWFVKASVLAAPALEAVKKGEIKFIPESWNKTYYQWLENIEDWCISRQLWWGHRIPAWFDENGKIYVGSSEAEIRTKYNLGDDIKLIQDEDVLDTWFSAALWPFSTLGWPNKTKELEIFYPTAVLVTGFDIIFFWVARMVMFGLKFTGEVPFKEVYITGLIRDSHGQKMSKSKGNVLDPVDLIDGISLDALIKKRTTGLMQQSSMEKIKKQTQIEFPNGIVGFGADALRFTFCALATTSRDINFDIARLEGYRNFCNKIWNATKFVLMQLEDVNAYSVIASEAKQSSNNNVSRDSLDCHAAKNAARNDGVSDCDFNYDNNSFELGLADKWIQTELQKTLIIIDEEFKKYRFDLITQAIYDFVWYKFCDWYLELTKPILNSSGASFAVKQGTCRTLIATLEAILRMIHPFMPFITEELWQKVAAKMHISGQTIMLANYPEFDANKVDSAAVADIEWLQKIILAIRNIRGEMNISPNKLIPLLLDQGSEQDKQRISKYEQYLKALAKIESINWASKDQKLPLSATALVDELQLNIPIANLIDINAEVARLNKEINKLNLDIERTTGKLANANYVAKAPADVVATERLRLAEHQSLLHKLQERHDELKILT